MKYFRGYLKESKSFKIRKHETFPLYVYKTDEMPRILQRMAISLSIKSRLFDIRPSDMTPSMASSILYKDAVKNKRFNFLANYHNAIIPMIEYYWDVIMDEFIVNYDTRVPTRYDKFIKKHKAKLRDII